MKNNLLTCVTYSPMHSKNMVVLPKSDANETTAEILFYFRKVADKLSDE